MFKERIVLGNIKHAKGCLPMSSNPASVFQCKRDQHVASPMVDQNRVGGVIIRLKLLVFNLFNRKSWDGCNLRQHCVAVDRGDHPIDDEVSPTLCKV